MLIVVRVKALELHWQPKFHVNKPVICKKKRTRTFFLILYNLLAGN